MNLTLVQLTEAHADVMFRWMQDPVVASNLGLRSEPSLEKTKAWLARAQTDDTTFARGIVLDGQHVGNVVLDNVDRHVSKARFHIYVGEPSARGRGIGSHAIALALALAFDEVRVDKVWLTVHVGNAGAIKAYTKAGFRVEGTHREEFVLDGKRIDELYMGILRREFENVRGQGAEAASA
jgi:RimJ/RimL family protein N-acetyltransferase